jgi:hypothetical protein
MADKIIRMKIDLSEVDKDWLFKGLKEKKNGKMALYLDVTGLFNEEQNSNGQNGMIVQDVPSKIYKDELEKGIPKSNMTKGNIIGNMKVFEKKINKESLAGEESGESITDDMKDDLPF